MTPQSSQSAPQLNAKSLGVLADHLGIKWLHLTVRGAVAVLAAILIITWPQATLVVFVSLIGIFAMFDGLAAMFAGVGRTESDDGIPSGGPLQVTVGIITVVAGVTILLWPLPTLKVVAVIFGGLAFAAGLTGILGAWNAKGAGVSLWGWMLAHAGLTTLLGLLFLVSPRSGIGLFVAFFAAYALLYGVVMIVIGWKLRAVQTS